MASSINASTSGPGGVITTADNSGILNLQSGGVTQATISSTGLSLPTNATINTANTFGFKNRIINGAMVIAQRGTSFTPSNGDYTLDRWQGLAAQSSKYTVAQSSTAPAGFINSLLVTSSSAYSVGSSDYFDIVQYVEGLNISDLAWGTANAKTVTLSFWVYSSLTGTFGGSLQNNGQSRSYPFSYSISAANTWTQISITIAGDTSGTWLTTNGRGIQLNFSLGTGSTFSGTAGSWASANYLGTTGATSVVGTSGATFYLTGVQLELGSQATSFDVRSIGTELALCQRYYEADVWSAVAANTNGSNENWIMFFKVPKRTTPTSSVSGTVTFQGIVAGVAQNAPSGNQNWIVGSASYGGSGGAAYYVTSDSGGWKASAEL